MKKNFQTIEPKSRQEFRKWLAKNHQKKQSVWVIIYKNESSKKNLSAGDVAEEALCFGWIDSVPNKIDEIKYKLLVSPRKAKSGWSALNKKRVKKLIENNMMTDSGLEKIKLAKKNGTWNLLESSNRLEIPDDLKRALNKSSRAKIFFESMAPSSKRAILEWINTAKKSETKQKRILETVKLAAIGIRANHFRDLQKLKEINKN